MAYPLLRKGLGTMLQRPRGVGTSPLPLFSVFGALHCLSVVCGARANAGFSTSSNSCASPSTSSWPPKGHQPYVLHSSEQITPDSRLLRYGLPENTSQTPLGPLPTCVKIKAECGDRGVLDKSYSPISLPGEDRFFDILVKGYQTGLGTIPDQDSCFRINDLHP
jgi:hypothetical protein